MDAQIISTELLTVKESTAYMRVSRGFISKIRRQGSIQSIKAGKKVLIKKSSLDAYLADNIEKQKPQSNG